MKKAVTAILSLFIMLVIALPCFADEGPGVILTADKTSVKAGETVKFTVSISDSINTKSGSIELSFPESFELVSAGWTLTGTTMANYDKSKNKGVFSFDSATFIGDEESGFVIFEFTLKAETVASTAKSVTASAQFKNGSIVVGESSATASVKIICATHSYGDFTRTKEPTCTEKGTETRTCSVCGHVDKKDIAALGHKFGDWSVTKEATETETGIREHTCSVCGKTETSEIPKLTPASSEPEPQSSEPEPQSSELVPQSSEPEPQSSEEPTSSDTTSSEPAPLPVNNDGLVTVLAIIAAVSLIYAIAVTVLLIVKMKK